MFRTIYILWWRQVKKFFRKKSRIIGALGQPLLMLFAFWAWFSGIFSQAWEGNYLAFLSWGIIAITTMMSSLMSGTDIIWDKEFWFMKEILVAPTSRLSVMIGRVFWWATTGIFQWWIVLILCLFVWIDNSAIISISIAIWFMILLAFLFTAFGIIIASLFSDFQGFQLIMTFLIMPLMFLSGAMFPLSTTPIWLQQIAKFNPLSYAVDWIRWALIWQNYFSPFISVIVLTSLMIISLIFGAYTFSRMKADS